MITFENFFKSTMVVFKGCKVPKRRPNYVSRNKYDRYPTGSKYWYGEDSRGVYVIRLSDHWVSIKGFNNERKIKQIDKIATCIWHIKTNNNEVLCGKAYLSDFIRISADRK